MKNKSQSSADLKSHSGDTQCWSDKIEDEGFDDLE